MQRGILHVQHWLPIDFESVLPSGHTVVDRRAYGKYEALVIEGPEMPECPTEGQEARVGVMCHMTCGTEGETETVTLRWEHSPDKSWSAEVPKATLAHQ